MAKIGNLKFYWSNFLWCFDENGTLVIVEVQHVENCGML